MSAAAWTINIDGAARGNPGPAAFAFVIRRDGLPTVEEAGLLGRTTNNVAEYTALVRVLRKALELGPAPLHISSDSELLVKQMSGEYRVKSDELRDLYEEAVDLRRRFPAVTITHVRRAQNARADELCNLVLDGKPVTGRPVNSPAAKPAKPAKKSAPVTDAAVREDCIACLKSAAGAWAAGDANRPPAEAVWEQLWSILEEGGVLKRPKAR
jgi:ribonuclease HI